jgi:hypothetical protein
VNRSVFLTGLALLFFGAAVFVSKVVVYQIPLAPSDVRGLWQIALKISVRGEGRSGSVTALLPASIEGQEIFDEAIASGGLDQSIRTTDDSRIGVWTGDLDGVREIRHRFRVQCFPVQVPLPERNGQPPPDDVARAYGRDSPTYPTTAPQVAVALEALDLSDPRDTVGRLRTVFAFVSHEIATVRTAGEDATLVLGQREGSREGKERLLVTLLRALGIPARNVRGLEVEEGSKPLERVWTEAWVDGVWVPMSTVDGYFATRPANLIVLGVGDRPLVEATGAQGVAHRYRAMREHLRPSEIAAAMTPDNDVLARLTLYRLPLPTQTVLRSLLLFPVAVLGITLFRNVIGLPTFGTFLPLLIAFSLRGLALTSGLMLIAFVIAVGVLSRLALARLRLLLVPRLSILLCLVILAITGVALTGNVLQTENLFAGVLFPIVILAMFVERFSIAIAEEGWREALIRSAYTVALVVGLYPIFRFLPLEHLMFSFPELVICIMGVLTWIGGYTGYRITDIMRFRLLAQTTGKGT